VVGDRLARFKLRKSTQDIDAALRFVVRSAAERVPFYKDLYARVGADPRSIVSVDDLARLPVVRRPDLLAAGHGGHLRVGTDPRTLSRRSTTGTTGEPLTVFTSRTETLFRKAALLDSFRRRARLPLSVTIADVGSYTAGSDIAQRLRLVRIERIRRSLPIDEQVRRLARLTPDLIEGRPSSLWALAAEASRMGACLPRPRLIVAFGEVLHEPVRRAVETAFDCRVADYYNCEEVGNIAWECPHHEGTMHLNPATAILEVVDDAGRPTPLGEIGRVLLTNLFNRTMPFIRYDTGDRASSLGMAQCSCGFYGRSIGALDGRDEDFFRMPDGRMVTPRKVHLAVVGILYQKDVGNELFRAVHRMKIVQEAVDRIVLRVVPGPSYSDALWDGVEDWVRGLHPEMRIAIETVRPEELESDGKYRIVTSLVPRVREGAVT